MTIPVFCVSGQAIFQEMLVQTIRGTEFHLAGTLARGAEGIDALVDARPRIVILDELTPQLSMFSWVDRLSAAVPDTRVLCYVRHLRGVSCQTLLSLGAKGIADPRVDSTALLRGIERVLRGEVYLSPLAAQVLALNRVGERNPFQKLSPRELTVCDLVIEGVRPMQIARDLKVSPKTVNTYRYRIFEKLGIASDVGLTHLAYRHGMKGLESPHERL
ncbi:MAG: hypothetical protein EBS77_02550 [Gammaproteobacteria bacterium]|nr:hypothetical protein [Gammaproteobacteria bacterium]